jgi:predicted dehydrogenase
MTRRQFIPGMLAAAARKKYRVAIIGDTGHGNFGHDWDEAWNGFSDVEVVAVADPDEAGRAKAAAHSRARKGYTDYREMLAREKPDIVAICPRWPDQRVAMVTAAADAGAHILMEKPFARSLDDADRMIAIAERRGIKIQVGHTARVMSVTAKVRSMLREGRFGQLMEMRARGKEDRRAGGEDLMVLGTHTFDLMRYFAGDPAWVFASVTEKSKDATREMARKATEPIGRIAGDDIAAMFRFQNGVAGYFGSHASDVQDGRRFGVTLYGSKGMVFVPLADVPSAPPYVMYGTAWVDGKSERVDYPPGTKPDRPGTNALMAADLMEAIESGRDPICSARDGRWAIEMVAGIYESHFQGKRLPLPLINRLPSSTWP